MRTTKIMTRTTRFLILVVLRLPTFGSNFATLILDTKCSPGGPSKDLSYNYYDISKLEIHGRFLTAPPETPLFWDVFVNEIL